MHWDALFVSIIRLIKRIRKYLEINFILGVFVLIFGLAISIPLLFQYYLDLNHNTISKTLSFDIKKSLFKSPENFTITVTAKYNTQQFIDQYTNPNNFIVDTVQNY